VKFPTAVAAIFRPSAVSGAITWLGSTLSPAPLRDYGEDFLYSKWRETMSIVVDPAMSLCTWTLESILFIIIYVYLQVYGKSPYILVDLYGF
jgi:hypothetical protein